MAEAVGISLSALFKNALSHFGKSQYVAKSNWWGLAISVTASFDFCKTSVACATLNGFSIGCLDLRDKNLNTRVHRFLFVIETKNFP